MPRKTKPAPVALVPTKPKGPPDLVLPASLKGTTPTTKAVGRGSFQRRVIAHWAPGLLVSAFSALNRACQSNDMSAVRQTLEALGVLEAKNKTSVVTRVNVNASSTAQAGARADAHSHAGGARDFEDIVRRIEEEKKTIDARNREFDVTPEGAA